MKKLNIYTIEEAAAIIATDKALQDEYNTLKPFYEDGELDHGFEYGNFFNLDGDRSVVIQWLDDNDDSYEVIVDSLEVTVVVIRDIENANGNIQA